MAVCESGDAVGSPEESVLQAGQAANQIAMEAQTTHPVKITGTAASSQK
jgi:hypothetical protein